MDKTINEIGPDELAELRKSIRSKALPGTQSFHADKLKLYSNNPRTEYVGLEDIRESMARDGFIATYPMEMDGDTKEVLSGNTRLLAAQGLSAEWKVANPLVAVVYKGLTEIEREIIAIEGNENRYELSFFETCATKGKRSPMETEVAALLEAVRGMGVEDVKLLRNVAERLGKRG